MEQTFIRPVQGHTLEFNRLLYPIRYHIIPQDFEAIDTMIVAERNEEQLWTIISLENLPGWVSEITAEICEIVKENENSLNS